jgi:preprotein translocase subunit SecG
VVRVLFFILIVGALALIVLSLLRRTPQTGNGRGAALPDDTGEQRALPPPAADIDRALSRATTMHLLYELAFGTTLEPNVAAEHVKVVTSVASTL